MCERVSDQGEKHAKEPEHCSSGLPLKLPLYCIPAAEHNHKPLLSLRRERTPASDAHSLLQWKLICRLKSQNVAKREGVQQNDRERERERECKRRLCCIFIAKNSTAKRNTGYRLRISFLARSNGVNNQMGSKTIKQRKERKKIAVAHAYHLKI